MTKYHSTVTRRDFLKALGLGGAGAGISTILPPFSNHQVRDLDELMSLPIANMRRPSWVKTVEKPTVEIDWPSIQRFDYHNVMWAAGLKRALGSQQYDRVFVDGRVNRRRWIAENRPGSRLQDVALKEANHYATNSFLGPSTSPTPESLQVPRYEGTPEENARMVTAFMRLHGASHVGFVELDTNTTEKLIYSYDTGTGENQGPRLDILDYEVPVENLEEGYRIIPKKARWVIVYTLRMADELMKRPITEVGDRSHYYMYNLKSLIQGQLQNFLRTLGYMGLGEATNFNALGVHTGFAVMAGLGEMSRIGHVITPEYGIQQRVQMVITDLPLAPGKPIDFGLHVFCKTCKKCADYCPARAINPATEPTWDNGGLFYRAIGIKRWWLNEPLCLAYIRRFNGCATCFAVCPFSKRHNMSYSDLFRRSVATNPAMNKFWRKADDFLFGSGIHSDSNKFWELDLPPFGYD